jgi:hypothetical protein
LKCSQKLDAIRLVTSKCNPGNIKFIEYLGSVIVIIPMLYWWINFTFLNPAPFYFDYDPEMVYFLDSLSVFNGQNYSFIDHPGTPVSILGSLLLAITNPFVGKVDFTVYHLLHPEIFLFLSHGILFLIYIICGLYTYHVILKNLNRYAVLSAIVLSLLPFAIYDLSFSFITTWSHNAFNYPFGMLLLISFMVTLIRDQYPGLKKYFWFGFWGGVLSAIQFYFIAWPLCMALTIFLFEHFGKKRFVTSLKTTLIFFIGCLGGFFLSIAPVIEKFPKFVDWIWRLTFHEGTYGSGPQGFLSLDIALQNLIRLVDSSPILFVVALFLIVSFLVFLFLDHKQVEKYPGLFSAGIGLTLQILLLIFAITKHPHPLNYYIFSVSVCLPPLAFINLKLLEGRVDGLPQNRQKLLSATLVPILAILLILPFTKLRRAIDNYDSRRQSIADEIMLTNEIVGNYAKERNKKIEDVIVLYTYWTHNGCYALRFGANYGDLAIEDKLSQVCPNRYEVLADGYVEINNVYYKLKRIDWRFISTTWDMYNSSSVLRNAGKAYRLASNLVIIQR